MSISSETNMTSFSSFSLFCFLTVCTLTTMCTMVVSNICKLSSFSTSLLSCDTLFAVCDSHSEPRFTPCHAAPLRLLRHSSLKSPIHLFFKTQCRMGWCPYKPFWMEQMLRMVKGNREMRARGCTFLIQHLLLYNVWQKNIFLYHFLSRG